MVKSNKIIPQKQRVPGDEDAKVSSDKYLLTTEYLTVRSIKHAEIMPKTVDATKDICVSTFKTILSCHKGQKLSADNTMKKKDDDDTNSNYT